MVWINLLLLISTSFAAELPKFLTKHSIESIRFISMDGKYAYVQKRPGVLGLVSSFRSTDFISDASGSDFQVIGSRFKQRLAIEVIPSVHTEFSLLKNSKIFVVQLGNSQPKEIGLGKNPKLHLQDEWVTFFDAYEKVIRIHNVITQKKYVIRVSAKANPFYIPEVEMVSQNTVVYTDINDQGYVALVSYNLVTQKSNVLYKATQNGTRLELCQHEDYLAFGEFPYEGVNRGSKISQIALNGGDFLPGHTSLYSSNDQDLGNIVCLSKSLYFIKTTNQSKPLNIKKTEAARLDLKTQKIELLTSMGNVSQLIEMDERVLIPLRGDYYVIEGKSNLGTDTLKNVPNSKEELPLEI